MEYSAQHHCTNGNNNKTTQISTRKLKRIFFLREKIRFKRFKRGKIVFLIEIEH